MNLPVSAVSDSLTNQMIAAMETIVVVEDETLVLELLVEILEDFGYHVRAFATADEAWQHIVNRPFPLKLLITDLQMPGEIDGVELVNRVHTRNPETPVIVASGFHGAANSLCDKKVHWLGKPFSMDKLKGICEKLAPPPTQS